MMYFCTVFMYNNKSDTICAIGTPAGAGGIAVIRVSGADTFEICSRILNFRTADWTKGRVLARVMRGNEVVDEVIASVFHAPRSYTGENVLEISCHGSLYIQQEILKLLITNGCRLATAGEFTQRAFFNGKFDLSQAEAVGDLIAATSAQSHRLALQQMRGGISAELDMLSDQLLDFTSLIELELDFADEDVEFADREQLKKLALKIKTTIQRLADSFGVGNAIKNGIHVAIAGETNVGKSTLLNSLLNDEKAIVSEIHGTTRDVIEDTVTIDGLLFRFMDTAGIRKTSDTVEKLGIERSYQKIEQAAIVLWMLDLSNEPRKLDRIISLKERKKLILILNKSDLISEEELKQKIEFYSRLHSEFIVISAHSREDISALSRKLVETANIPQISDNDVIISNLRHYEALIHAQSAIEKVIDGIHNSVASDLLAQDIRECLSYLNEISGKQICTDDVLKNIFNKFCIGK